MQKIAGQFNYSCEIIQVILEPGYNNINIIEPDKTHPLVEEFALLNNINK